MARILVVDDDAVVRHLLHTVLKHLGHEVVEAQNGREGLRQYKTEPASLIITDIQMPEMDGVQMIKEIRRDFPDAVIIAISADFRSSYAAVEALGVQGTLEKPFSLITLRDAVQELLRFPSQRYRESAGREEWPWTVAMQSV